MSVNEVQTMKPKIGVIGLGNMGFAMASRLLATHAYDITVYNRTESKARPLIAKGAKLARSPSDLADSDFILTMLADDKAVKEVVNGTHGFAKTFKKGATHVMTSTISTELSRELSEQHTASSQKYVAAPVLGRPDAAEAGKLFILAGGELSPEAEAILTVLGQKIFRIPGEAWRAHLLKLACNFMLASAIETMAEAFALIRKGGVAPDLFLEIFSSTVFSSPAYKNYGAMIAAERYQPEVGFKMPLAAKDIRLALDSADELKVPMPVASVIREQMMQALANGDENLDWVALGKIASQNAGLKEQS